MRAHMLLMFSRTIVPAACPVSFATVIFAGLLMIPSGVPAPVPLKIAASSLKLHSLPAISSACAPSDMTRH